MWIAASQTLGVETMLRQPRARAPLVMVVVELCWIEAEVVTLTGVGKVADPRRSVGIGMHEFHVEGS